MGIDNGLNTETEAVIKTQSHLTWLHDVYDFQVE